MQIGFVGLGRMGGNMVHRIHRDSEHQAVAFDTSGGVWGLELGYCMMVGGPDEAVDRLSPILDVLAPPPDPEHGPGWRHMGPTGSGHYVKMVHNGVEYGMMQAYAEGFALFDASAYELDNAAIAHLWMRGGGGAPPRNRAPRGKTGPPPGANPPPPRPGAPPRPPEAVVLFGRDGPP